MSRAYRERCTDIAALLLDAGAVVNVTTFDGI